MPVGIVGSNENQSPSSLNANTTKVRVKKSMLVETFKPQQLLEEEQRQQQHSPRPYSPEHYAPSAVAPGAQQRYGYNEVSDEEDHDESDDGIMRTYYSKDTGLSYTGWFANGYITKTGTVHFPDGTSVVKEWPPNAEKLSFRKAIAMIEAEKIDAGEAKRANYTNLFAAIRESELQSYVADVREDIKEDRRERKLLAQEEKKRLQREAREKERDRRLQSLLNADGEAIEGAEEEVKLLRLEKEEAMAGRGETPGTPGNPGIGPL